MNQSWAITFDRLARRKRDFDLAPNGFCGRAQLEDAPEAFDGSSTTRPGASAAISNRIPPGSWEIDRTGIISVKLFGSAPARPPLPLTPAAKSARCAARPLAGRKRPAIGVDSEDHGSQTATTPRENPVTSPMRRLDPKVTQSGIEAGSLKTQRRHRADHAKIGDKPPLNGNPEEVTTLWITLGMTRITHYCKSCFLDIGAESRR
jgi:hypothetical protein